MPTHESFLAAIAAEPHERDARLVYADWLEDQGDARAELIRVMEEMHTLAPYSDRFWELRPRRAQLKQGVSDDWLTALGYNVYRPLFTQMPAEREHRWRLITEFIETWHGPLGDSPGNTEEEIVAAEERLGLRLPAAMREWYGRFGNNRRAWGQPDQWSSLEHLEIQSGHIRFLREDQNITRWGIPLSDLDSGDPQVRFFDTLPPEDSPWYPNNGTEPTAFSEFAAVALFWAECYCNRIGKTEGFFNCDYGRHMARQLPPGFRRASLSERFWVCEGTIWEINDVICIDTGNVLQVIDYCDVYFVARNRAAISRLRPELRSRFRTFNGEKL
jgi:uncharacterized protein (TIGR02996 family)